MTNIPTWHERAMSHPDHQSGMVSEDMIRARMCEEIEDLRAEVERLRAQIVSLEATGAEASDEIDRLRAALRWYADLSNHLPVERRNPGDPDPVVVVFDQPPILRDSGTLARKALEGKP